MTDKKATEVVGQLRKLVRMFEAVSAANDTIQMMSELEQTLSKLNADVAKAEEAANTAKVEVDKNTRANEQLAQAITQKAAELHLLKNECYLEENDIVVRARKEADRIAREAETSAESMERSIVALEKEKSTLAAQVTATKDELLALQAAFIKEKERVKKALGV